MPRILQSPAARLELLQIFNEIAADNLAAAERMIERFDAVFRHLAVQPEMAEQVPRRRRKNIRRFPVGNYVVILSTDRRRRGNPTRLAWRSRPRPKTLMRNRP